MSGILSGKIGVVMGVANERSIAWICAEHLRAHGAFIVYTYQGERLLKRLNKLVGDESLLVECDVSSDEAIVDAFAHIADKFGKIDFLIHSIAFANKETLGGRYCDVTKEDFLQALDISCYSFTKCAHEASKIMNPGGSMFTLSYYGAEKVVPNYNLMGVAKAALECSVRYIARDLGELDIRVNCISAGPVKTLAASAISGFSQMTQYAAQMSPMNRNVEARDLGGASVFLVSDLSSGITGEVLHVDTGQNIIGFTPPDAER